MRYKMVGFIVALATAGFGVVEREAPIGSAQAPPGQLRLSRTRAA